MFEFRVTKYDPKYRRGRGRYLKDEWTSRDDIGRAFCGVVLTGEEYERVENAYVTSAIAFLEEADIESLTVSGLENYQLLSLHFGEGSELKRNEIGNVVRQLLRADIWCRLENSSAFIHVGYDYYMYIGVSRACPVARKLAEALGLFVERFLSPHRVERRTSPGGELRGGQEPGAEA